MKEEVKQRNDSIPDISALSNPPINTTSLINRMRSGRCDLSKIPDDIRNDPDNAIAFLKAKYGSVEGFLSGYNKFDGKDKELLNVEKNIPLLEKLADEGEISRYLLLSPHIIEKHFQNPDNIDDCDRIPKHLITDELFNDFKHNNDFQKNGNIPEKYLTDDYVRSIPDSCFSVVRACSLPNKDLLPDSFFANERLDGSGAEKIAKLFNEVNDAQKQLWINNLNAVPGDYQLSTEQVSQALQNEAPENILAKYDFLNNLNEESKELLVSNLEQKNPADINDYVLRTIETRELSGNQLSRLAKFRTEFLDSRKISDEDFKKAIITNQSNHKKSHYNSYSRSSYETDLPDGISNRIRNSNDVELIYKAFDNGYVSGDKYQPTFDKLTTGQKRSLFDRDKAGYSMLPESLQKDKVIRLKHIERGNYLQPESEKEAIAYLKHDGLIENVPEEFRTLKAFNSANPEIRGNKKFLK